MKNLLPEARYIGLAIWGIDIVSMLDKEEGIEVWNTVLEQIVKVVKIGWIATWINQKVIQGKMLYSFHSAKNQ